MDTNKTIRRRLARARRGGGRNRDSAGLSLSDPPSGIPRTRPGPPRTDLARMVQPEARAGRPTAGHLAWQGCPACAAAAAGGGGGFPTVAGGPAVPLARFLSWFAADLFPHWSPAPRRPSQTPSAESRGAAPRRWLQAIARLARSPAAGRRRCWGEERRRTRGAPVPTVPSFAGWAH